MDQFKRYIFPLLVFIIIVGVLVYRLASCSASINQSGATPSPTVSAAVSGSPPAPSPSASPAQQPGIFNYNNDDIIKIYKNAGFAVKDIRDAGNAAMVQFYTPGGTGDAPYSFAWFDRTTGARDVVVSGVYVDKFEVTADKKLTVLTTGRDSSGGTPWFPEIITSVFNGDANAIKYVTRTSPFFIPASESYTISDDRRESLKSITFDYDGVSFGFAPQPGHESDFATPYKGIIPRTNIASNGSNLYITFFNTTLPENFVKPEPGAGDKLRSFVSVKNDGNATVVTLKLGPKADRYNVSMAYSPDTGSPYAVLKIRSSDVLSSVYPTGW